MSDGINYYVTCENCGRENHPQQVRCWVCGYHFPHGVPAEIKQPAAKQRQVARTVATGAASGIGATIGAFFITLGGILGGILIGIFLAISLVVALFAACIEICTGGNATLFF